jgi:uncharacterized protein (DUF58 family)
VATRRTGFTTRASCLLAAGVTAILCGLLLGEIDLLRAGVLAAAVPCVAAVVVQRSQVRIANRRTVEPNHASAGESVTVHLVITNKSVLRTGTLLLEDQLPQRLVGKARFVLDPLGSRETRTVSYRMPGLGRGHYRVGPLRVRLRDPFRLIDVTRSFTATSEFLVAPVIDQLPAVEPPRADELGESFGSHSVGMHGADDQSTREYRTGDDLRKIHWRSTARTGLLMVRQEERPWRGQTTVLLDLRSTAHVSAADRDAVDVDPRLTSSLEWAVSAAASIGHHFLIRGRELGLLADPSSERLRLPDTTRMASHLAGVHAIDYRDLAPLAAAIRNSVRDSALIAVLGTLDPVSLRTLADAHPRGRSSPAFAILLDSLTWRDSLSKPNPAVDAAAAVLRNAGWRVCVARCGDTTPDVWELLLAGFSPVARGTAALR